LRLERADRKQMRMDIGCLNDRVPEDHTVRVLWEVTGKLDLSRFYCGLKVGSDTSGRSAKDPRLLVALWLYAATEGFGSAHELERRCQRDDCFKWLCGGVHVNYHTLSDFRTGHGEALDDLLTQVLAVLVGKKLVRVYRICQDGTDKRTDPYQPRPGDSEAVKQWRARMGSQEGQAVYRQRGAIAETVNGDLKTYRGLGPLLVRGIAKGQVRGVVVCAGVQRDALRAGVTRSDRNMTTSRRLMGQPNRQATADQPGS
jgi:transposase